ncbi:limbic system-associated membrane protein [Eurytemora carolleeae]|uniref:limbic system-associated membrane protein n=1 Tax=Eurytemora carolleeae TaxID=1294199 RepID=UPI000C78622A|nr:limbic system-associated membrane protein [Eurytemora carolleeae]|eukprot:XP_023328981.1 limbic system-associated membrane protein-like [Eurytemora affinis]
MRRILLFLLVLVSPRYITGERIPPQVDVYYEYIREGEILDLVCRVRAHPPSFTTKWMWDKDDLDARVEIKDYGNSHILRIHIHNQDHYDLEGYYTCITENAFGESQATLRIDEPGTGELVITEVLNGVPGVQCTASLILFVLTAMYLI